MNFEVEDSVSRLQIAAKGKLKMLVRSEELSYKEFSDHPDYVNYTRDLVTRSISKLPNNFAMVDVATGTGLVPRLAIEEAAKQNKKGIIFGIDPNTTSLNIAKEEVTGSNGIRVKFIEGYGQDLRRLLAGEILEEGVDCVSILGALHEIPNDEDKEAVVNGMADVLKPGGIFIFNSTFTRIGVSPAPSLWGKWILETAKILGEKRDKNADKLQMHPVEFYRQLIEKAGLKIAPEDEETKAIPFPMSAWIALAKYSGFAQGAFQSITGREKYSDQEKSSALIEAAENVGYKELSRNWTEMTARKPLRKLLTAPTTIFAL